MQKAYKYRLRTSKTVESRLESTLEACRELYNAGLQERRDAWKRCGMSINYAAQCAQLPEIKAIRPELSQIHSQVLQQTLKRLQRAFENFFRRVKAGDNPGYPRFKGKNRYDSFTYPQSGWKIEGDKLTLCKIGSMRLKLSRPIEGTIKTITIKREAGKWYTVFSCEVEPQPLSLTGNAVGLDLGLKYFVATSDGEVMEAPKFLRASEEKLKAAQQDLSIRKKGSAHRERAKRKVGAIHRKIADQRRDWLHKLSTRIIQENDIICYENLNIAGMVKNHHLAKSIMDAAWGMFVGMLVYKAEWAGRLDIDVYAPGTTIDCSGCGMKVPKTLSTRFHECPRCGLFLCRDLNAALNILARGLNALASGQGAPPAKGEPAVRCRVAVSHGYSGVPA